MPGALAPRRLAAKLCFRLVTSPSSDKFSSEPSEASNAHNTASWRSVGYPRSRHGIVRVLPLHRADSRGRDSGPRRARLAAARRTLGASSEVITIPERRCAPIGDRVVRIPAGRRSLRAHAHRRAHRLDPRRRPPRPRPPGPPRGLPPPAVGPDRPVIRLRPRGGCKHDPGVPEAGPRGRPRTPRRPEGPRRGPRRQGRITRDARRAHRERDRGVLAVVQARARVVQAVDASSGAGRGARRGRRIDPRVVRAPARVRGRREGDGGGLPDHGGEDERGARVAPWATENEYVAARGAVAPPLPPPQRLAGYKTRGSELEDPFVGAMPELDSTRAWARLPDREEDER